MSTTAAQPARRMLDGTIRSFLAEALFVPTGLITAAFLTRRLGAQGYGLFTLAGMIVAWLEWGVASLFSRATVKFVSEAEDWQPVAHTVIRLYMMVSGAGGIGLFLLAKPLAAWLNEPVLADLLRLFAIQVPLFGLTQAHRNILIGMGAFRSQSQASASRWIARVLFIVIFVEMGFDVSGAILGSMASVIVEFGVCRLYIRPSFWAMSSFPARSLMAVAAPLFLFAISMRLAERMDLLLLKVLGGTAKDAGIYGAAQNLSLAPGLFAIAFSPVLLSTLNRLTREGNEPAARHLGRQAMRVVLGLLPFTAAIAGAAHELAVLIFGHEFFSTGDLLRLLVFGALAQVMTSIVVAILVAAGRPMLGCGVVAPLVPLSIIAHLLIIPRFGAIGAASVTLAWAVSAATVLTIAVYSQWRIFPPAATIVRSIIIAVMAYLLAAWWPVFGLFVFAKLIAIGILIGAAYFVLGEFNHHELSLARSMLPWPVVVATGPDRHEEN
jgi:O-antigen/teichoic acid export membrane protein